MSSINFDNAYLLLIALPLLALLCIPFFIAVKKDNRNGHNIASMVLHVLMALLIAFAAAGTTIVSVITRTEVYVVADVSYSADKNLDTVDSYINDLSQGLPLNTKLGIVCFGKDYQLTTELGKRIKSVKEAGVDDTETNIAEALEYTGGLFHDGVIKRIVLITDGKHTYGDSNGLVQTVAGLQAEKVHLDAIYLDDNISKSAKEVQISKADFTSDTYLNRKEQVSVEFAASFSTTVSVTLYKNGEKFGETVPRQLSFGPTVYKFDLDTGVAGTFNYRIEITNSEDENELNNVYSFTQTVADDFNVLLVSSPQSEDDRLAGKKTDEEYLSGLYGETVEIDVYEIVDENSSLPVTVEELCGYDEIILSNVDLTLLPQNLYDTFLDNLDIAVAKFGKSLLTFGNLYIQDKTEGELNKLNDMLPVRYGDSDTDKKLYTIVMDVSHSMDIASRMIIARQAAMQLVELMNENDSVCLITFSGEPQVVQPITSLANRESVLQIIEELTFQQGTMIAPALETAYRTIVNRNEFSQRQVLLITDGIPYGSGDIDNCRSVVENMYARSIFTSVICVGAQNYDYRKDLKLLAESYGGGKFYLADTEQKLKSLILNDFKNNMESAFVEDDCWIKVELSGDALISGDESQNMTALDMEKAFTANFVLGKKKLNSVQNVLSVSYEVKNENTGNKTPVDFPLYAYWNYSEGKVKTYAAKLQGLEKPKASEAELKEINDSFFTNVINSAVPALNVDAPFKITASSEGKTATVLVTPAAMRVTSTANIKITAPSGETSTAALVWNGSGFTYSFDMRVLGKYGLEVEYNYGGATYTDTATVDLAYEPEYDAFTVFDSSILYKMLNGNGTVSEDGKLEISNDDFEVETFVLKLTLPFLIISVALFVADIIIRKLKWNDIVSLFGGKHRDNGKGGKK